jgi:alpha-glucosidase
MFLFLSFLMQAQETKTLKIPLDNSAWWAGIVNKGEMMPLENGFSGTFYSNYGNQVQPLLISDDGQTVWSENPYSFEVRNDTIFVSSENSDLLYHKEGNTLKEAFLYAVKTYFPPSGKIPDKLLFSAPQYNTWIELMYDQNQEDILRYARNIIDNGFPPGVLMIDDNWQEDYGKWDFHPGRFSSPGQMIDTLHSLGFKVMLWVCPFVSPDCDVFRELSSKKLLLKDTKGRPAIIRWWNGASAELDLSNPETQKWFRQQLNYLQNNYGVDGFKFDAGDFEFYKNVVSFKKDATPQEQCELYAETGLSYPLNEYRAMWKMAGKPLVNRLRDKSHSWKDVQKLIPDILLQGIIGYNFTCPDMVGGGEFTSFLPGADMDQDLIVRSAQIHALMPMMQFSVAPWRVLDKEHFDAVKKAVEIRKKYTPLILELAESSAKTGEPIVRPLEYVFPHRGFEKVTDQFMLGSHIMVAPVVSKNNRRVIKIPKGKWKDNKGKMVKGPKTITADVGLDEIPVFELIK